MEAELHGHFEFRPRCGGILRTGSAGFDRQADGSLRGLHVLSIQSDEFYAADENFRCDSAAEELFLHVPPRRGIAEDERKRHGPGRCPRQLPIQRYHNPIRSKLRLEYIIMNNNIIIIIINNRNNE